MIQYNLNLGFSGIVIFNNDENKSNNINEPLENCVFDLSVDEICRKYIGTKASKKFGYRYETR